MCNFPLLPPKQRFSSETFEIANNILYWDGIPNGASERCFSCSNHVRCSISSFWMNLTKIQDLKIVVDFFVVWRRENGLLNESISAEVNPLKSAIISAWVNWFCWEFPAKMSTNKSVPLPIYIYASFARILFFQFNILWWLFNAHISHRQWYSIYWE